eukprot:TRINITY_DN66116_c7_g2_i1.p1 TRINITY_DN66116_c7_g2~~TRINITY_DN66116_c7_g2_i1.p1  ORF type:complete len:474 (+),score=227.89 TRINITY_DN66116_c7_g2_i1:47-1468(+)
MLSRRHRSVWESSRTWTAVLLLSAVFLVARLSVLAPKPSSRRLMLAGQSGRYRTKASAAAAASVSSSASVVAADAAAQSLGGDARPSASVVGDVSSGAGGGGGGGGKAVVDRLQKEIERQAMKSDGKDRGGDQASSLSTSAAAQTGGNSNNNNANNNDKQQQQQQQKSSQKQRYDPKQQAVELKRLLEKKQQNNAVLLLAGNIGYIQLLENMICRLKSLQLNNYLVAAFDSAIYEYCRENGIATFLAEDSSGALPLNISRAATFIGQPKFAALTKLKSIQVLRVLKAGYDVLFSDLDVYFMSNPLHTLQSTSRSTDILVASDRKHDAELLGHYCNSGFYFVRSNANTIKAFEAIVQHARQNPDKSEQPSFNAILCGEQYQYRRDQQDHVNSGEVISTCENNKLRVNARFLSQKRFLNGDLFDWDEARPRMGTGEQPITVHANWNYGILMKVEQLQRAKLWTLDFRGRCIADNK